MPFPPRILVFGFCVVAGFFAARPFIAARPGAAVTHSPAAPSRATPPGLPPLTGAGSALIAEWERLREEHGGAAADLGALFLDINGIKDPFRRRAFQAALLAEWAAGDPQAALAFLNEKGKGSVTQFLREWLRIDPQAAVSAMLASKGEARKSLNDVLNDVAKLAPERLAEAVAALPKSVPSWDTKAQDAFAIFARKDPAAARAAAESVTGPQRRQALAGVAKAWAENDAPAALSWAQGMAAGEEREAATRAVLVAWAKIDPVAALGKIELVPPGAKGGNVGTDVGAEVLRAAATKDWDATLTWLHEHPAKLGGDSFFGMENVLTPRLGADPAGTMRSLAQTDVPEMLNVLANSLLNNGYGAHDAVWQWLDGQPVNNFTRNVREEVLSAVAYTDPDAALAYMEKIPDTAENRELLKRGASSLFSGDSRLDHFDDLLSKSSPKLRPYLLKRAFDEISGYYGGISDTNLDPAKWIPRLAELPSEKRTGAGGSLASGWAGSDPHAAIAWASSLADPAQRDQAIGGAVGGWAKWDPYAASEWIDSLPAGKTRDIATLNLLGSLVKSSPEAAWTRALSIETPERRTRALEIAYEGLSRRDPEIAKQFLQGAKLSEAEIAALQKSSIR